MRLGTTREVLTNPQRPSEGLTGSQGSMRLAEGACEKAGERRAELAEREGVEGAEAVGQFGLVQAALAVKAAEKILGRLFPFLRVAFHTARYPIAVGIVAQPRLRHDVVQALHCLRSAAQTVEALAALAGVDGLSQPLILQKVRLLDVNWCAGARAVFAGADPAFDSIQPHGANLVGQPHLHHMSGFAALDQAQSALGREPAHGLAYRPRG